MVGANVSRELSEDVLHGLVQRFPLPEKALVILLLFVSLLRNALVTSPLAEGCATSALDTIRYCLHRSSERTRAYSQDDTPHLYEFSPHEGFRYSKTLFAILSSTLKVILTIIVWSTSHVSPTVYTTILIIGAFNGVFMSCIMPVCCYLKSRRSGIVYRSLRRSLSNTFNKLIVVAWVALGSWLLIMLIQKRTRRL